MNRIIIITVLSFFVFQQLTAQQKVAAAGLKFHSVNQVGLLQGESKAAVHLQSVNGFKFNKFFAGVGTGLDYYRYKSIPLFADLRKYFGKTNASFYVYADAGLSFVWEKKTMGYNYSEKYRPGFYGGAGAGYKTGFKNGTGLVLDAGYSYKGIYDQQQQTICPFNGPCYLQPDTYRYHLNRLLLQVGWIF